MTNKKHYVHHICQCTLQKKSSYHKGPPTSKKMHFILDVELIEGWNHHNLDAKAKDRSWYMCSAKL